MSDPTEFKEWIDLIDQQDTIEIDRLIEHKVKTLRRKKHIRWVAVPLSSILSLVITFALLVNLNDAFYVYALNTPVLSTLTKLVNGRQDILSAFDSGYVQIIDQSITVGDYTLEVDSIISDTRSINMFYRVKDQNDYINEYTQLNSQKFDFMTLSGEPINYGVSFQHFENYWWAEISLTGINHYDPFILRYTPNEVLSDACGELHITVDQSKVVQPVTIQVDKSMTVAGQRLFIKSLEMGAFTTRLSVYPEPKNDKLLVLYGFKGATSGTSFGDHLSVFDYYYESFPFGQLNHKKTMVLELKNASVLDKAFQTVTFDPKDKTFTALPKHLRLKEVVVVGNKYEIILEDHNSVGNQGLIPLIDHEKSDTSWSVERSIFDNTNIIHISFSLFDEQIVKFSVIGGTEVTEFPAPITIKLP